jgi:outer membrane protein, multidrug efflux system
MRRFLPLLFLAGCTLGPNHEVPEVCLPCHYEEAPCETEPVDLSVWWHQFDDCLLDEFVEEALACNYDLNIALHKIEEIRALYKIDRSEL